jgi:chromosome segregation protein
VKIERILVCGFRGCRELVDIPVAPGFTVIDGRNGAGKSTLFDAIEFALTGQITKYGNTKAGGESIEDYLWWKGDGPSPTERFVEVIFKDGEESIPLRRTPIAGPAPELIRRVEAGMINARMAPPSPLLQLCAASIIRDENIASLSLDLPDTQRYAKLRQAIGASDAEEWTNRANTLLGTAKKRSDQAKADENAANAAIVEATRRIDEIRTSLAPETAIAEATATMVRLLAHGSTPPDQLVSPAREYIAQRDREVRDLAGLLDRWQDFERAAVDLADLDARHDAGKAAIAVLQARRAGLPNPEEEALGNPTAELVAELHQLRNLGTRIGLVEHHCPLCAAGHDDASFAIGLARAAEIIGHIDARASEAAAEAGRRREAIVEAERRVMAAQQALAINRR